LLSPANRSSPLLAKKTAIAQKKYQQVTPLRGEYVFRMKGTQNKWEGVMGVKRIGAGSLVDQPASYITPKSRYCGSWLRYENPHAALAELRFSRLARNRNSFELVQRNLQLSLLAPVVRVLLTLLLPLLLCTSGRAQETITLEVLQQQAAQTAIEVLIARQQLQAATLEFSAFEASQKPRIDLVANLPNYFRTSTEVTQNDGTVAFREIELNNSFVGLFATQAIAATGGTISLESRLQRTDNLVLDNKFYNGSPIRLFYRQPILAFNPFKWDKKLLPLAQTVSERELAAARAGAALTATDRFFDLVSADQERGIAEVNKAANEQLFTVAKERYELGKINRGDLVQLQLELTSAEQNLLRAKRLVLAASAAIYRLLGKAYDLILLRPDLPLTQVQSEVDEQRARQLMASRRPEILAAQQRTLEAEREEDRIRRDLGPRIDLEAGFGFVRNDIELSPIYTDPQNERILSVNLSLPILDWGQRKALTKRAASSRELAVEIARRTELELGTELVQLLEQWKTVQEELRLATAIKDLANERFDISRESYELGAIPLAQLTQTQQFRDQNTRAYADTLRAYWFTYASLARLTLWDFINDKPLG
jgi:outer membrane protein TolC